MKNEGIMKLATMWNQSYNETEDIVNKMKSEFEKPSEEQIKYEKKLKIDEIVQAYFDGYDLKEVLGAIKKAKEVKECD